MKAIRNNTRKPIKILLHGGRVLHLGPNKTGQVSDHDAQRPSFKKLVEQGDVSLLDETVEDDASPAERKGPKPQIGKTDHKVIVPTGGRTGGGKRER